MLKIEEHHMNLLEKKIVKLASSNLRLHLLDPCQYYKKKFENNLKVIKSNVSTTTVAAASAREGFF